jgi:hypothetical protein
MSTETEICCQKCGHSLPSKARFCLSCGANLAAPALRDLAQAVPEPKSPIIAAVPHRAPDKRESFYASVAVAILVILTIIMAVGGRNTGATSTVPVENANQSLQSYVQSERKEIERELNRLPNDFGKHIENIHLTVTYKQARVKSIEATTVDGSNNAGTNGDNISEINVVITAYWVGKVQQNGFTEIRLVYDPVNKNPKRTEYLNSNALFNSETVDWFKVGWTIGALLAM